MDLSAESSVRLRNDYPELTEHATQPIDRRGAFHDEPLVHSVQDQDGLLLDCLDGNKPHARTGYTVSAGIILNVGQLTFQVTGGNLFNSHGLTESNPRSLGGAVPTFLPDVRPIFGRSLTGSVTLRF